jgi:hypothetical protein
MKLHSYFWLLAGVMLATTSVGWAARLGSRISPCQGYSLVFSEEACVSADAAASKRKSTRDCLSPGQWLSPDLELASALHPCCAATNEMQHK